MRFQQFIYRSLVLLGLLLLWHLGCPSMAFANSDTNPKRQSIQFSLGSGFRIESFKAGLLSYQFDLTRSFSVRIGLSYYQNQDDYSFEYRAAWDPYTLYEYGESYRDRYANYYLDVLRYHRNGKHSMYYGLGLVYGYSEYSAENSYLYDRYEEITMRYISSSSQTTTSGVSVFFGSAWEILDWLSIHAEYSNRAIYQNLVETRHEVEDPYDGVDRRRNEQEGWLIESLGVRFGISLQF